MKKNNRKSESFIVTDTGEWVDSTILEEYKISAKADMDADGSKQVHEEDWAYGDYILAPKYDPKKLIDVLDLNSYHRNCVDVVARDSSGLNYSFQPKEERTDYYYRIRGDVDYYFRNATVTAKISAAEAESIAEQSKG